MENFKAQCRFIATDKSVPWIGCANTYWCFEEKFIKTIAELEENEDRLSGSVSVALFARSQGVQIFRVHDVKETVQAMKLWHSIHSE